MKKGKTSKIFGFNNVKIVYGTVDSFDLKSIYLNIQTWVEPIVETDNWNRVVLNMSRAIKHSVYNNIDDNVFHKNFILDLDLRSSGLVLGKKSFLNLEVTFFIKSKLDFKSFELRNIVKDISKIILSENFSNNKYFIYSLTKSSKKQMIN